MGCRRGKYAAQSDGTTTTTTAPPSTTASAGPCLATSNTSPNNAPKTVNANPNATIAANVHVANVGRERGRESPISAPEVRADLGGRNAPSVEPGTVTRWPAVGAKAPMTAYWKSRAPPAPAIVPTPTNNAAAQ